MSFFFGKSNAEPVKRDLIESAFEESKERVDVNSSQPTHVRKIIRPSAAIDDQDIPSRARDSGANFSSTERHEILSPSHHQWESVSIVEDNLDEEVEMTENECLMRISALQRQIELLKLDIDRNHDKLRSLDDYEEPAVFMKELVGGSRWAIEGMAAPHCTETLVDCGETDSTEVSIRDCHGDIQFSSVIPVKIKVEGRCRRICISRSTYLYLTVESCSLELVINKCENITIVCGGHPPKIIAEDTHGVTISLCFQLMIESIVQLRCSNISINSCDRRGIP